MSAAEPPRLSRLSFNGKCTQLQSPGNRGYLGLFVLGNLCVTSAKDVWGTSDMEAFLLEYHTMGTWPDPAVPDLLHLSGKLQGAFKDFAS